MIQTRPASAGHYHGAGMDQERFLFSDEADARLAGPRELG